MYIHGLFRSDRTSREESCYLKQIPMKIASHVKWLFLYIPGTFSYIINIPETPVPAKETTYICMLFEFPTTDDFHLVAHTPALNNIDVMHHIIVYGCDPESKYVFMAVIQSKHVLMVVIQRSSMCSWL